jgi:hypothetical protein
VTLLVRTVLDARRGSSPKYLWQVCLLAASWRCYASDGTRLEVVEIGRMPSALSRFLRSIGVRVVSAVAHAADAFSRSANKIQATFVDRGDAPLLLVDNDTCFVSAIDSLTAAAEVEVMAAAAGTAHVTDAQWEHMDRARGLRPLACEWVSLDDRVEARRQARTPLPRPALYVNAGVLWLRHPASFGRRWTDHILSIADLFASHPLDNGHVRGFGSDQASLATAIGDVQAFAFLPEAFNYRPPLFWLGQCRAEEVRILHLTGLSLPTVASPPAALEASLSEFWERRIERGLRTVAGNDRAVWQTARQLNARVRSLVETFALDEVVQAIRVQSAV